MKISIILAVYNESEYLEKCLQSLISQEKVDFEIILVDDGSETPVNKLKFAILANPKIKIFRLEHKGPALARNFGATKASGEILVFLDGDMSFEKTFLANLIEPIKLKKTKGTYSSMEYVANWDNVWARCWNFEQGLKGKLRINYKNNMIKDFRAILKTEFELVKGFENTGYTDTWTLFDKLKYLPYETKAVYYHYNPSNLTEVYHQSKWIGGRQRKFGNFGKIIVLLRSSFPISIIIGIYKGLTLKQWQYLPFKLVYDWGTVSGVLTNALKK